MISLIRCKDRKGGFHCCALGGWTFSRTIVDYQIKMNEFIFGFRLTSNSTVGLLSLKETGLLSNSEAGCGHLERLSDAKKKVHRNV